MEDVKGRFGPFEVGAVINISLGGLALETSKYLQVGRSYPITLKRAHEEFSVGATVVWSQLIRTVRVGSTEVQAIYRAGFRFQELSLKLKRDLEAFVIDDAVDAATGDESLEGAGRTDGNGAIAARDGIGDKT